MENDNEIPQPVRAAVLAYRVRYELTLINLHELRAAAARHDAAAADECEARRGPLARELLDARDALLAAVREW
jgi:hypothetical protein